MAEVSIRGAVSPTMNYSKNRKEIILAVCNVAWVHGNKGDVEPFIRSSHPFSLAQLDHH